MTQSLFLTMVAAGIVANLMTLVAVYAFVFMWWREKKTGREDWPAWVPFTFAVPLLFTGIVIWAFVLPNGR